MSRIYHIAPRADWEAARARGAYDGDALATEGFIHCSFDRQLPGVAAAFFAGRDGLVVLAIDPGALGAELRIEGGFPHLYGPLEVGAVLSASGFDAAAAAAVERIAGDGAERGYRRLPGQASGLHAIIGAPQRLVAHHIVVHDVACRLLDELGLDAGDVRFGAATHDIGKALVPGELSGPGHAHEAAGERWLLEQGVPASLARFARTHGGGAVDLTDRLVILADKAWKGARIAELEEAVAAELGGGVESLLAVSDAVERAAEDAPRRLAWQGLYPVV